MSDKKYTEQDVRNIISIVCGPDNTCYLTRNGHIDQIIADYTAKMLHPSESAGVKETADICPQCGAPCVTVEKIYKEEIFDVPYLEFIYRPPAGASAVWVKGVPNGKRPQYFAKVKGHLSDDIHYAVINQLPQRPDRWEACGRGLRITIPESHIIEYLDESPSLSPDQSGKEEINYHEHEKEVMMQAFDKVRKIFESRSWIMQGRGSYPYNDDRYKEEVRYMYDEFDELYKDTWKNIKSKTFEYRNKIIEQYKRESGKEDEVLKLFQRILNQANHGHNTSNIDRLPAIKRLAKQGIEIFDPHNRALND